MSDYLKVRAMGSDNTPETVSRKLGEARQRHPNLGYAGDFKRRAGSVLQEAGNGWYYLFAPMLTGAMRDDLTVALTEVGLRLKADGED